jgi:hypothetical protein
MQLPTDEVFNKAFMSLSSCRRSCPSSYFWRPLAVWRNENAARLTLWTKIVAAFVLRQSGFLLDDWIEAKLFNPITVILPQSWRRP